MTETDYRFRAVECLRQIKRLELQMAELYLEANVATAHADALRNTREGANIRLIASGVRKAG